VLVAQALRDGLVQGRWQGIIPVLDRLASEMGHPQDREVGAGDPCAGMAEKMRRPYDSGRRMGNMH